MKSCLRALFLVLAWGSLLAQVGAPWVPPIREEVPPQAQVAIIPKCSHLLEGKVCRFRIANSSRSALPEGLKRPEAWRWTLLDGNVGTLDEATGTYTAPTVANPSLVRVRATCRERPEFQAEIRFLVLPHQPFDTVAKVLGPDWMGPTLPTLPFLNPVTGARFDPTAEVHSLDGSPWSWPRVQYGGYGLPFTLKWRRFYPADAEVLTCGGELRPLMAPLEAFGPDSVEVCFRTFVRSFSLEALQRVHGPPNRWQSRVSEGAIHLRGVVRHAGNDLLGPGHQDGRGLAGRFTDPFGLAPCKPGPGAAQAGPGYLVTEPRNHVIRLVGENGEVGTGWGQPGQAGHLDTPISIGRRLASALGLGGALGPAPREALFNAPTFLWSRPWRQARGLNRPWDGCLVADTGNHVIREIRPDGTVSTLAGHPGRAGHQDADLPREALFNHPQGLVEDRSGNIYVADAGNQVIRRIAHHGQVTTLAGSPGAAGDEDGFGAAARFTDLKGLAILDVAPGAALYVVDGHAIRRIILPGGQVTTMVGQVAASGFKDVQGGDRQARLQACRQPCLNQPCGLLLRRSDLLIADLGNHCVRTWVPGETILTTLAGDPSQGETHWGLLRDGAPSPPGVDQAALEAPRTLVSCGDPDHPEDFLVTTGCCLARVSASLGSRDLLGLVELDCGDAVVAEPCVVRFSVEARTASGGPALRRLHYSVAFLDPDDCLVERLNGVGTTSTPVSVQGSFAQPGRGRVVVRCVTDQGVAASVQRHIEVR